MENPEQIWREIWKGSCTAMDTEQEFSEPRKVFKAQFQDMPRIPDRSIYTWENLIYVHYNQIDWKKKDKNKLKKSGEKFYQQKQQ